MAVSDCKKLAYEENNYNFRYYSAASLYAADSSIWMRG